MKKLLASLALFLFASANCQADVITGDFKNRNNVASSDSFGNITLSLNANGTVAATLNLLNGRNIVGFGSDSALYYYSYGIPAAAYSTSWGTGYGTFNNGVACFDNAQYNCGTSMSWTVGTAGQFSSVMQMVNGTNSSWDFWMYDSQYSQYGAMIGPIQNNDVPEPGSLALLFLGLAGLTAARMAKRGN